MIWRCIAFSLLMMVSGCGRSASQTTIPEPRASIDTTGRMSAGDFHAEIKKDLKAAEAKYIGKTVEFFGTISRVDRNIHTRKAVVNLKSEGLTIFSCSTKDQNLFGKVVEGQEVVIRTKIDRFSLPMGSFSDCDIVEVGPSPAIVTTATEVLKEWSADPALAAAKWKKETLIVTGKVADKKVAENKFVTVFLETGDATQVACEFTAFDEDHSSTVVVGETVTLVGQFQEFSKDGPALGPCMRVQK